MPQSSRRKYAGRRQAERRRDQLLDQVVAEVSALVDGVIVDLYGQDVADSVRAEVHRRLDQVTA